MKKFRVLFRKSGIDGQYIDNGIALWLQIIHCWRLLNKQQRAIVLLALCHEEIWTPDEHGNFGGVTLIGRYRKGAARQYYFKGDCWTSTMGQIRNKNAPVRNGTVVRPASYVLASHPERFCFIEIEVQEDDYYSLIAYMLKEVANNKGYGKRDIGKFFGLGFMGDPKRNICSEFANNGCIVANVLEGPLRVVEPLLSAILLVKKGYKIQELVDALSERKQK